MSQDEIISAMRDWLKRQKNPDKKFLFIGMRSYSAKEVLNHIEGDNPEGKLFREQIVKLAVDLFMKGKKPG